MRGCVWVCVWVCVCVYVCVYVCVCVCVCVAQQGNQAKFFHPRPGIQLFFVYM